LIPELELFDCQDAISVDQEVIEGLLPSALEIILKLPEGPKDPCLTEQELIEISILSDKDIGEVHAQFLDDPSPTDVITFHHGEILASADTAAREAKQRGWPMERELLLYLIHGLLHLHGYDDHDPTERERMHRHQGEILDQLWPQGDDTLS